MSVSSWLHSARLRRNLIARLGALEAENASLRQRVEQLEEPSRNALSTLKKHESLSVKHEGLAGLVAQTRIDVADLAARLREAMASVQNAAAGAKRHRKAEIEAGQKWLAIEQDPQRLLHLAESIIQQYAPTQPAVPISGDSSEAVARANGA